MTKTTDTERAIAEFKQCESLGIACMKFTVGRYNGFGTAVIGALRRRGFDVSFGLGGRANYELRRGTATA